MKPIKTLLSNFGSLLTVENVVLLKGGSLIFVIKIIASVIAFLSTIIITRYSSSPTEVGNYFFIVSVLAIASTVSRAGFDSVITRFVALANKDKNYGLLTSIYQFIMRKVLLNSVLGAIVLVLISISLFYLIKIEDDVLFMLVLSAFLMVLLNVNVVVVQSYQGIKNILKYAVFNALSRGLLFILLVLSLLFYQQLSLMTLLSVYLLSIVISTLISFLFWHNENCIVKPIQTTEVPAQDILKSARTLWGVSVLAILMSNGAAVLLGVLSNPEQVALFATANRVALLVSFILIAINGVLSPKFAELSSGICLESNRINLQRIYRSSTRLMLIVTLPLFIFVFTCSEWILSIFGNEYIQGSYILRLIIAAHFVKILVGSVGQLLVMTGNGIYQRQCLIVSISLLLILLLFLTPTYGALGGAWSVFFAVVINNLLGMFYVHKKLNISLL